MLREERSGILYSRIQAAKRFISNGEELGNMPSSVREATADIFHEADLHGRFWLSSSSLVMNRLMLLKESCWHSGNRTFGRGDVTPGRWTWVN